jgi:hypothetical protein
MTAPTVLTVPEVLRRAEQVIAERGWCQEDFTDDTGAVCARGAINLVVAGDPEEGARHEAYNPLAVAAAEAVAAYLNRRWPSDVSDWNDEEDRTESEVRDVLLAAAQRAEAGS